MRTLKYLFLLFFLAGLTGCNKQEDKMSDNPDVEIFIKKLKTKKYNTPMLPAFTYKDIPALLQYRNEDELITDFPSNSLSSLYMAECKLGMYVLWTIEAIRTETIIENNQFGFPSQNPILALRYVEELKLVQDELSHRTAAEAYNSWWQKNKHNSFDKFKKTDPLKNTNYRWH